MSIPTAFMKSPFSGEIREVGATAETLSPLMAAGWHQVPAPAKQETVTIASAKEDE